MTFLIGLLTSRLAGPAASIVAVILLALCVGQCTGRLKAEHRAGRAEAAAAAAQRDLGTCRANTAALSSSIDRQNAALTAQSAADARRLAQAGKDLTTAQRGRARAEAQAEKLMRAGPVGVDACARAIDAFETVKEQAR